MKKIFFITVLLIGQLFAQNYTKIIPRPFGCYGSGAIVNDKGEVLFRVDEPPYIFTQRVTMEINLYKNPNTGKIYFVAQNGKMYSISELHVRWQRLANVDNRYLAGEEFSRMHYGPGWLTDRPLKYLI